MAEAFDEVLIHYPAEEHEPRKILDMMKIDGHAEELGLKWIGNDLEDREWLAGHFRSKGNSATKQDVMLLACCAYAWYTSGLSHRMKDETASGVVMRASTQNERDTLDAFMTDRYRGLRMLNQQPGRTWWRYHVERVERMDAEALKERNARGPGGITLMQMARFEKDLREREIEAHLLKFGPPKPQKYLTIDEIITGTRMLNPHRAFLIRAKGGVRAMPPPALEKEEAATSGSKRKREEEAAGCSALSAPSQATTTSRRVMRTE